MPKLVKCSDQEWLFAYELVVRGDMSRAMDIAYPKASSYPLAQKMSLARRIRQRRRVDNEIRTIQNDLRSTHRLTIDQHLQVLADIRDEARGTEQYAAAVRAEELRGRAAGFYFEQHVHVTESLSGSEMRARLAMILDENPRLRELLESQASKVKVLPLVVEEAQSLDKRYSSEQQAEEPLDVLETSPSD